MHIYILLVKVNLIRAKLEALKDSSTSKANKRKERKAE
jgi:hypothetical protein